jgi:hypothetical protein
MSIVECAVMPSCFSASAPFVFALAMAAPVGRISSLDCDSSCIGLAPRELDGVVAVPPVCAGCRGVVVPDRFANERLSAVRRLYR